MTDIDDLLARLETEGCDRGRYYREAAAVIRELMATATEPTADLVVGVARATMAVLWKTRTVQRRDRRLGSMEKANG